MSVLREGFGIARRERALLLALFAATIAPALVASLPLDLALAPYLDLRPWARGLVEAPADDGLLRELLASAPALSGVALAAVAITIAIGVPATWLATSFLAARALGSSLEARGIAGRGLGAMLATLPLRALPLVAAALLAWPATNALTLDGALPGFVGAGVVYLVGASTITVVTDFARGLALAAPDRPLLAVLRDALRAMTQARSLVVVLVLGEAALGMGSIAILGMSRPLGVLGGRSFAVALAFIAARTFLGAAFLSAAARGAALRSA